MLKSAILLLALTGACSTQEPVKPVATGSASNLPLVQGVSYVGVIFPKSRAEGSAQSLGIQAVDYWTPDLDVITKLESHLRDALERGRATPEALDPLSKDSPQHRAYKAVEIGKILDHFGQYRRQYIGIVSPQGARRVLVNCFPAPGIEPPEFYAGWRQQLVVVDDGGFWYWRILYDVDSQHYLEFDSNGYA